MSNYNYKVLVDTVNCDTWMKILQNFDDATIYQTWAYGAVRWGENKLSHLMLERNGKIVAIAQCVTKKLLGLNAGIAYVPWGPIWQLRGKERDPIIFQQMIHALKQEYVEKKASLLRIVPNLNSHDSNELFNILEKENFRISSSETPRQTLIMNLEYSIDELRQGLKRQWKQNLTYSENNGLKVIQGTSDELFSIFIDLYKNMLKRKKFESGVDINEFREIQKALPEKYKMEIMVCEFEKMPVAGLIATYLGNTSIALLAATNDKGLEVKGAYFLQWQMIGWLKKMGARWYDLGGINPITNPGGFQYKKGLSGKFGNEVCQLGQFELSNSLLSSTIVSVGDKILSMYKKLRVSKYLM